MLKSTRLITGISLVFLVLTTGCSQVSKKLSTTPENTKLKVALAAHLKQVNAKFYGASWCPYCHEQKEMFGEQAMKQVNYIECDEQSKNARPDLCAKANIRSLPTWEINGKQYRGMLSLDELADLSNYQGDRNFGN